MSTKTTKIELGHSVIVKRADGIVQIIASNLTYNVDDIKALHKAVLDVNDQKKALLLLKANNFTSIDNSARHFLSTPEAAIHSLANAYLIKSLAQRMLLNFMIKVNGTSVPTRFFTDEAIAIEWLMNFEKKLDWNENSKNQNTTYNAF